MSQVGFLSGDLIVSPAVLVMIVITTSMYPHFGLHLRPDFVRFIFNSFLLTSLFLFASPFSCANNEALECRLS